jgi:hypothetical protein
MIDGKWTGVSEQSGWSRRDLATGAVGALALALGGLGLPEQIVDVEARSGVLGGKLGGRRRKDHRGRGKRHRRHRRSRKNRGGGRVGDFTLPGVALSLHNFRSQELSVRYWGLTNTEPISYEVRHDWQLLAAKPASGPEPSLDFAENGLQLVAELNTGHIIWLGNRPIGDPWITVGTGGWSKDGWSPQGATLIDASLDVGDTANALGFQSQRVGDDDDRNLRRFFVYLVP